MFQRVRLIIVPGEVFAQFAGDIHGHVSGPALVGIEGADAGRMSLESIAGGDQLTRCQASGFAPSPNKSVPWRPPPNLFRDIFPDGWVVRNSQPCGLADILDGDDSIVVINEPNEGPYFGSCIFPSIGLPTADGA